MLLKKIKNILTKVPEDVYGVEILSSISGSFSIPPLFTSSALRPICLAMIINDIVINKRNTILELGSGVTTLYLASAMKLYSIKGHIYSIDENKEWLGYVKSQLTKEGLNDFVTLIHAPAKEYKEGRWYSFESLDAGIPNGISVDCIVVDGPTAYGVGQGANRYLALPYFFRFLSERHLIYLDDTNRKGEQGIVSKWEEEYNISFKEVYGTGAVCTKGEYFNFMPL